MQPFGLWQNLNVSKYMLSPGSMPLIFPILLFLAAVIALPATFGYPLLTQSLAGDAELYIQQR